jgi:hypothetical protein
MHALLAVGLGCYSGGFQSSQSMNICALVCFWVGGVLLGAAFWHLRKAPDIEEILLPPSESWRH